MPSYLTKAFFLLAAVLALSGCSSQRPLMPTPEIYTLGSALATPIMALWEAA